MLATVLLLVCGILILSAALTAPVYAAALALWPQFSYPFSRVFDRVAMLVAIVMIVALRRRFDLAPLRTLYRFGDWRTRLLHVLIGILLTTGSVLIVLPVIVAEGRVNWLNIESAELLRKILKALGTGLVVSIIEETFFRGLLFQALKARLAVAGALLLSSALYAAAHFIAPVKTYVYPGFGFMVGFDYLAQIFGRFGMPGVLSGILGLALVGAVLCLVLHRSGSIFLCIGMHAGWVVGMKLALAVTSVGDAAAVDPMAGLGRRYFLVAEPLTWLSIVMVGVLGWLICGALSRGGAGRTA